MDWDMILRMTLATLIYVIVTGFLWKMCHKKESFSTRLKVLIGLIYGGSAVLANHIGIDYGSLVLNVRDIGPLAAGLFFSPLSGIIAGIIGGAERILAAELWNIGVFTKWACGISTFLAGILAAILNVKVYQGKRPSMTHAFFIGAVMEVFHMYAVLFTNRDEMNYAYYVVKTGSVPMIVFTAIGMTLCSAVIMTLSGEVSDIGWRIPQEKVPVTVLFQRALLFVTIGLFVFNFVVSYNLQTRLTTETTQTRLQFLVAERAAEYAGSSSDLEKLKERLRDQMGYEDIFILIDGKTGQVMSYREENEDYSPMQLTANELEEVREKAGKDAYIAEYPSILPWNAMIAVASLKGDCYLLAVRDMDSVYESRTSSMYESTLSDILMFTVFYMLVAMLAERVVVRNLHRVNASLRKITGGKLDERVWVHTSAEFTDLSEDINKTVTALRGYIDQAEQKMKEELKLAATIQDAALPKNFTLPTKNVELHALMTPARQVGGDFYDFFYIGIDQLCLVIADVSGKGIPASLFMMRAKTAIKNYARSGTGPAEILQHVNNILCEGNDAEMFVTVWIGILDLTTGQMQCANAGHEYPVLMNAGGDYELVKDKHGLVLAAMENIRLREYELTMTPGSRLFVYTDGIPEAINEKEKAYGTDRLVAKLNRLKTVPQEQVVEDVLQDIRNFAGEAEQFDDITMIGLTFLDKLSIQAEIKE